MAFSQLMSGEKITPYLVKLVVDTDADIAELPTHYAPGSTVRVVASANVYMLNTKKEWIIQPTSGSGGSGGSTTVVVEGSLATEEDIDNLFN